MRCNHFSNALDKEIGIHKLIYSKTWGVDYSKGSPTPLCSLSLTPSPSSPPLGFFPAEMVFTERAIPTLVKQGIQWVVVANNHLSRACQVVVGGWRGRDCREVRFFFPQDYPYSSHGDNNSPPNRADQVCPVGQGLLATNTNFFLLSCRSTPSSSTTTASPSREAALLTTQSPSPTDPTMPSMWTHRPRLSPRS